MFPVEFPLQRFFFCRHCNIIAELAKIIKYILTLIKFFGETLNNACIQKSKLCKKTIKLIDGEHTCELCQFTLAKD